MHPNTASRLAHSLSRQPGERAERLLRRIRLQIEFARAFCALETSRAEAGGWADRIDQASALLDVLRPDSLSDLEQAVAEAENILASIGAAAKGYTVTCVGHGHIDMNWMWSWPETVSATHDTFASVLSLMRQYPGLTYSQSQASVYALMEKYHPTMFEEIRERVREGRWEVTAVHWVEGDKNIASGESLARHLLYTRRYFAETFDLSAEDLPVDWEPDTFGHANTIPTILSQAGVKYYYGCRLGGGFDHAIIGDFPRPRLFWWQGPDGSRVLVNRESTWYNSYVNIGDNIALPALAFFQETGLTDWLNIYGIGNHGGGPTRTEIDYFLELQTWPIYPKVVFGTAKAWFDKAAAAPNLPVLDHELNFEFTGCYTSQSLIKQANRFGENYLVEAETLATVSLPETPKSLLRDAWLNVLFNQFHDILPGSGVRQTREHATALFQEVGAITGSIKREAGKALAREIDTLSLLPDTPEAAEERRLYEQGRANTPFVAGAGIQAMESGYSVASGGGVRFKPFVVYNPCAWERSEPVQVVLYDTDLNPGRIVARDENGVQHPTLVLGHGHDWGHRKITVLFLAQNIPALGYKTFVFCEGSADIDAAPRVSVAPRETFETPFIRFQYLRALSGIRGLTDKRTDARIQHGYDALGIWRYLVERSRGMTAWVLGTEIAPRISLRATHYHVHGASYNEGTHYPQGSNIAYIVHQHLEAPDTRSTVRLATMIHGLEPRIDVTAEIDWREIGDAHNGIPGLAVDFAFDLAGVDGVRYETPFGSVLRYGLDEQEVPSLRYAHLSGEAGVDDFQTVASGITLLQDCKYGHTLGPGNNLRLRMIRSSFDPDHAPEICRQTVRYSLYFHDRDADPATLNRLGAAWNHPLIVFPADIQQGSGSPLRSFARVETPNVVLSSLKRAEEGDGLVLRLVEYNGDDTEAVVMLDSGLIAGKTRAEVVDLMERPTGATGTLSGNRLTVPIRAHSFVTVRLQ